MSSIAEHSPAPAPARPLEVVDWGLLPYDQAMDRQAEYLASRVAGSAPDRLVLVEHPPVVTAGRYNGAGDLRLSPKALDGLGVAVHRSTRGGQTTFHGPGQMVAYGIVKLAQHRLRWYVWTFLEAAAGVLEEYGLTPLYKEDQPGLWVGDAKIVSIGIALKRRVTCHGISMNVNNDLTPFSWIVPCGHPGQRFTSISRELGREVDMAEVKRAMAESYSRAFNYV